MSDIPWAKVKGLGVPGEVGSLTLDTSPDRRSGNGWLSVPCDTLTGGEVGLT
jgi:hypothetical protein